MDYNTEVMPEGVIKRKHLDKLTRQIEDEWSKDRTDHAAIKALKATLETVRGFGRVEWLEQALRNMDAEKIDKPGIREKIMARIDVVRDEIRDFEALKQRKLEEQALQREAVQ